MPLHAFLPCFRLVRIALAVAVCALPLAAQSNKSSKTAASEPVQTETGYVGLGRQTAGQSIPFSFGWFYSPPRKTTSIGFDVAGEGVYANRTAGEYELKRAYSFNLLVGLRSHNTNGWRVGLDALLGARVTNRECPASYIGFECYAGQDPEVSFGLNAGGIAHVSFQKLFVGARVTGESSQLLLGVTW